MEENMKVIGLMENNMVKENTSFLMEALRQVSGKMEKELDGLIMKKMKQIEAMEMTLRLIFPTIKDNNQTKYVLKIIF